MDRLTEIELFVRVAELHSMTRAAAAMNVSNSAATRMLAALEKRLGAVLIKRTTRRLALTERGAAYLVRCQSILADMQDADSGVQAGAPVPTGTLRITGSLTFCLNHVVPLLRDYTRLHPRVSVEVISANRPLDLVQNDIHVGFRGQEAEDDPGVVTQRLVRSRRMLVASPGYLARRGVPHAVEDLLQHDMLLCAGGNRLGEFVFRRGSEVRVVKVKALLQANDAAMLRAAALDGLGVLALPRYVVHEDVVAGRLLPLLGEWELPGQQMNIVYQSLLQMPAKVRTFIDFVVEHFERMDYERKWTGFDTPGAYRARSESPHVDRSRVDSGEVSS